MKKIASLATALMMATAFCGFCTACASDIKEDNWAVSPAVTDTSTATTPKKVILDPGRNYSGSGFVYNSIAATTGVTEMTKDEKIAKGLSFAEETNAKAYFVTLATGTALPTPTSPRTGLTFGGWRYAEAGELVTVTTMPDVSKLSGDLYLYAHWTTESTSSGGQTGGQTGGQDTIPADSTKLSFNGGSVTIKLTNTSGKSNIKVYAWNGNKNNGNWPGGAVTLGGTTNLSAVPFSGASIIINWGSATDDQKTGDIPCSKFTNGGSYTISLTKGTTTVTANS